MIMTNDNYNQFVEFEKACDKMLESNYVLVDKSISGILKAIAKNKHVFNLIAEQVISFNFAKQFELVEKTNIFALPESLEERVAFCFCLLNEIDNKNISVTKLIYDYFSKNMIEGYDLFCKNVVEEFRNGVRTLANEKYNFATAGIDANQPLFYEPIYDSKLVSRIIFVLESIQTKIDEEKRVVFEKKNMATAVCQSAIECLLEGQQKPVLALFFGLKSITQEMKRVKNDILELESLILNK